MHILSVSGDDLDLGAVEVSEYTEDAMNAREDADDHM